MTLIEAAQQEPMPDDLIESYEKGFKDGAAQRTWVGLTDEEVDLFVENRRAEDWVFVRSVEAKLKEKNHD